VASFKEDILSALQLEILQVMPDAPGYYLSGASALSGVYLQHRTSQDLDFFCAELAMLPAVVGSITAAAPAHAWLVARKTMYAGHERLRVTKGDASTLVDVIFEPMQQIVPAEQKPLVGSVHVDSLADLVVNKICAVIHRSDVKDLVDLFFLQRAGEDLLSYLSAAQKKEGGVSEASLAYSLQETPTDPSRLFMRKPVSEGDLKSFRDQLVDDLVRRARERAERG
jgi:predicted nucleotidyltransferase component of viral defense system